MGFESRPRNSYSSIYVILNFNEELAFVSGASTINSESWSFSGAFGSRKRSLSEGTYRSGCFQGSILITHFCFSNLSVFAIEVCCIVVCGDFDCCELCVGMWLVWVLWDGFSIVCMMVLV